jgi:deazaflavin-dependent oxidoreductase (nitroreductase family)
MFDQSMPKDVIKARDNAHNQPMSKETISTGNRMMIDNILNTPPQPYQDGKAVYRVVEIPGRKTQQIRQTPLAIFQYAGQRYLIAPSSGRDWVYNLIASTTCTLLTKASREQVHATLTLDDTAIKAVQAYMAQLPDWSLRQFPFPATASAEEIQSKKDAFAVFHLV